MRILFYLPVVTDAWLDAVVVPMIRAAAAEADVHVIVPPLWNGTGVDADRLARLSRDAGGIWHWFDDPGHPALRTAGSSVPELMRRVEAIAADYTICRSADVEAPSAFPGKVAFLMEADYPPFARGALVRLTGPAIFAHGVMPALTDVQRGQLVRPMAGLADALSQEGRAAAQARAAFLARAGLPDDRPIVAMPLEHDGADNFYMLHSPAPRNAAFVEEIAAGLGERCVLALTVHPAQRRDPEAMARLAALESDRVRILHDDSSDLTPALARHCDAMVFRDSKSIAWAALFGKPLYRLSRFATGDWMHAASSPAALDGATYPQREDALLWLGFHLANDAFSPNDGFRLADLVDRIERPLCPERWTSALARRTADLSAAAAAIASLGA